VLIFTQNVYKIAQLYTTTENIFKNNEILKAGVQLLNPNFDQDSKKYLNHDYVKNAKFL
jgi:hypothetical protein